MELDHIPTLYEMCTLAFTNMSTERISEVTSSKPNVPESVLM